MADRTARNKKNKGDLEGMKVALAGGVSRLDQLEMEDEGDVYELVDEDQYASIVERRRNEDDFVVDDNGLGYHDDGEEHLGIGEDDYDAKKRLKEAAKDGDNRLSKKARKLAESSLGPKNSILRHMQSAVPGASSRVPVEKKQSMQAELDIDSLLGAGPGAPAVSHTTKVGVRPPFGNAARAVPARAPAARNPLMSRAQAPAHHYEEDHGDSGFGDDGGDDGYTEHMASSVAGAYTPPATTAASQVTTATTAASQSQPDDGAMDEGDAAEAVESAQPKLSLSKGPRKLQASQPSKPAATGGNVWGYKPDLGAAAGSNALNSFATAETAENISDVSGAAAMATSVKIDPRSWLLHSKPAEDSAADGSQGDKGEEYVNLFWLDATENNGVIYLFGKLPVNDAPAVPAGASQGQSQGSQASQGPRRFVSCCVAIHGCERNLFVLPRLVPDTFKEDGTQARLGMADVYKELSNMLVPSIVPRTQGQTFKCKSVRRKYAFEHGEVPREETEYMKVVYSATHGVPSAAQCNGGKTYERIFGAGSSALELFLLKRKLMGPCWITIRKPKLNPNVVSWCKVEIAVDNPKDVVRVASGGVSSAGHGAAQVILAECGATPNLTCMSISMKTAVNPVTHLHEIVMLSGVVHNKIDCEADSEVANGVHQSRFTLIRQLGVSCGSSYPAAFPHDLKRIAAEKKVRAVTNERELLSLFFSRLQQEDPDIISSHNLLGFECDVLLARAVANKLPNWSLLGRLRKSKPPRSINEKDCAAGRILCDTYKAAKEFLRETTYSLTHLAASQLKCNRTEVDPIDVPKYFSSSQDIMNLASANMFDATLVQGLMLKLQVIPLTKQLTNLSGNLWSRTIRGARAERIEYLLLHEFHQLKYVLPEKKAFGGDAAGGKKKFGPNMNDDEDGDEGGGGNKVGGNSRKRAKAGYAGGLVLEPKKGLYDTYILLLDFNSLYPSIIQEYNLCFTTIEWTKYMPKEGETATVASTAAADAKSKAKVAKITNGDEESGGEESGDDGEDAGAVGNKSLAPLPRSDVAGGVLPRVIKTLVDRRRVVKDLLKKERDPLQRQQLDIRQKALKLTANSMYGCLGFSFSRFYARPIAALVTAMGREALQRTVDFATTQMSLDVIYGDTDSVMINTNLTDLASVKEIGLMVKKEVNKLYRSLELDLDGIFKSMLLLKKKKYAALVINEGPDGKVTYEKEMKGLDLVRRDWCGISKETGTFVVEQILSGKPREEIVQSIHDYLTDLSAKIRAGQMPLEGFIVTKGLNKNPKDYPDCKGQAHLQVALQMLKANKPVNIGDHIPYVICVQGPEGSHAAQRAYHPDDVTRAAPGEYTLDYEWYLSTQILPPISRLCEPIEGTSPAILSERLGLDASKYARSAGHSDELLEEGWGFTPKCMMDDAERFQGCLPLTCVCSACDEVCEVRSVQTMFDATSHGKAGLSCDFCGSQYYGKMNAGDCYSYLSNRVTLLVRACMRRYYECWLVCDDPSCGRRTMQQSVKGFACTENCHGRMVQEYDELALHTQLKCLESLFDVPRMQNKRKLNDVALRSVIPKEQVELLKILRQHMSNTVEWSAYNWIRPSLWTSMFAKSAAAASHEVIGSKL